MAAIQSSGLAYLFDSQCGVPGVNWVDAADGEGIIKKCSSINMYIVVGVLGLIAAAVAVVSLTVKTQSGSDPTQTVPVVPLWVAAIPAGLALLALTGPFFAVRKFRSVKANFTSSGLDKTKWIETSNANAQAGMQANATVTSGMAIAGALLAR